MIEKKSRIPKSILVMIAVVGNMGPAMVSLKNDSWDALQLLFHTLILIVCFKTMESSHFIAEVVTDISTVLFKESRDTPFKALTEMLYCLPAVKSGIKHNIAMPG